jgi:hypothetical protein
LARIAVTGVMIRGGVTTGIDVTRAGVTRKTHVGVTIVIISITILIVMMATGIKHF